MRTAIPPCALSCGTIACSLRRRVGYRWRIRAVCPHCSQATGMTMERSPGRARMMPRRPASRLTSLCRSTQCHAPQREALVVEAFQSRFHRLDAEAIAGLGQERFHVRVMANGSGDDHVRARGETLEPGPDVDAR